METGPHGRKHRTFQEEEGFDFRESAARRLISAELRAEEDDVEDIEMPGDELCGGSESEEQEPMESSVMGLWQNTPVTRSGIWNE